MAVTCAGNHLVAQEPGRLWDDGLGFAPPVSSRVTQGLLQGHLLQKFLTAPLDGKVVNSREEREPLVAGSRKGVHHVHPLGVGQLKPPLLAGGVLLLGLDPALSLRLCLEEHPLALAIDPPIGAPLGFIPHLDLLCFYRI